MVAESDHRLPRTAVPSHYQLTVEPNLAAASFAGCVAVDVDVRVATNIIVCNAAELRVTGAELVDAAGFRRTLRVGYDTERERIDLGLDDQVGPGRYRLHLDFEGVLNDELRGFYRSAYRDDTGTEHVIATTQFEATDARRAFPCWDEPAFKATFDISLVVPAEMTAISCSPVVANDDLGDGRRRVRFGTTMPLSTYLLAFVVGDLEATDPVDVNGTPLRIVHVPGKSSLTGFALEFGAFALRWFADYYRIPYPGAKLDLIAVPDFAAGAMENLGAVIFRESLLLVDPDTATQAELSRVAEVIAHELAHMWFGDLVTMKWWNGLWLKEAFATFMEVLCVDAFRPEWKSWLAFAAERDAAMETDALVSTRPIEFPVLSPDEADEMFDDITYGKGAAVLRMLQQFLGPDTFQNAIAKYLADHAYANADTPDLWKALDDVSEHPIDEMMNGWIFRRGHPVISLTAERDGYRLSQRRFLLDGDDDTRWQIPLLVSSARGETSLVLEDEVVARGGDDFIANSGGHGFYRVRYAPHHLAMLTRNRARLDPLERHTLVVDTWAGVLEGHFTAAGYLSLVGAFGDEEEAQIWDAMLAGLDELDRVVSPASAPALRRYVTELVGPVVDRIGWEPAPGESDLERRRRGSLLRALGVLGHDPATVDHARSRFDAVVRHEGHPDSEVGAAVIAIVAAHGAHADYESVVAAFRGASNPQDEVRYLRAMTSVPDGQCAATTMSMILDGQIRTHHVASTAARLIGNRHVGPRAWALVTEHWDDLLELLPPFTRRNLLAFVHLRSEPHIAPAIATWLGDHPLPAAEKAIAQQLERLAARTRLRLRESNLRPPLERTLWAASISSNH